MAFQQETSLLWRGRLASSLEETERVSDVSNVS
jgi:hypothetical protein